MWRTVGGRFGIIYWRWLKGYCNILLRSASCVCGQWIGRFLLQDPTTATETVFGRLERGRCRLGCLFRPKSGRRRGCYLDNVSFGRNGQLFLLFFGTCTREERPHVMPTSGRRCSAGSGRRARNIIRLIIFFQQRERIMVSGRFGITIVKAGAFQTVPSSGTDTIFCVTHNLSSCSCESTTRCPRRRMIITINTVRGG